MNKLLNISDTQVSLSPSGLRVLREVSINDYPLQVVEYKGERVVSSYDIAKLHNKPVKRVNEQFERNKERLKEGVDYFLINKEEFTVTICDHKVSNKSRHQFERLFTERGYLKLVKSFTDDLSWQVIDLLTEKYFIAKHILQALSNVTLDLSDTYVVYKDNDFYTSSLAIAKLTGKQHDNVLRDIEQEVSHLKSEGADFSLILEGFKEVTYLDEQGKPRKSYELNEIATYQILLRYSPVIRALFIHKFKQMKDAVLDMFKLKVLDAVLPEYKGKRQYVYIIKNLDTGNVKVGVGSNPVKRLEQLQTGSDAELSLVYTSFLCSNAFSVENEVHKHFEEYHARGEWFRVNENEVISYLEQSKYSLSSEFASILKEEFE